jgi:hypothetical protein
MNTIRCLVMFLTVVGRLLGAPGPEVCLELESSVHTVREHDQTRAKIRLPSGWWHVSKIPWAAIHSHRLDEFDNFGFTSILSKLCAYHSHSHQVPLYKSSRRNPGTKGIRVRTGERASRTIPLGPTQALPYFVTDGTFSKIAERGKSARIVSCGYDHGGLRWSKSLLSDGYFPTRVFTE